MGHFDPAGAPDTPQNSVAVLERRLASCKRLVGCCTSPYQELAVIVRETTAPCIPHRLREDLLRKETKVRGSLSFVESRTYQDVQEGLQKLSTLPEETRAPATSSVFDRPRLFSGGSR